MSLVCHRTPLSHRFFSAQLTAICAWMRPGSATILVAFQSERDARAPRKGHIRVKPVLVDWAELAKPNLPTLCDVIEVRQAVGCSMRRPRPFNMRRGFLGVSVTQ